MKILVGNNAMADPGGSETYTYAIIKELVERGHEVTCCTNRRGMVANEVEKLGVQILFEHVNGTYDLALLSHSTSIALSRNVEAFKIQTCHGIYPTLEQPISGMDHYVVISKEVQNHLALRGIDSTLIKNGIDCKRFKPSRTISKSLKTVLSLSHSDTVNALLSKLTINFNCQLIIQNKYKTPIWNIEEKINQADLVVTLGRGAYEAMACERNVLILDQRGYVHMNGNRGDGLLTGETYNDFVKNNCSGRFSKKSFNYTQAIEELFKYKRRNGKDLRKIALKQHNIELQVDKYLSLVR